MKDKLNSEVFIVLAKFLSFLRNLWAVSSFQVGSAQERVHINVPETSAGRAANQLVLFRLCWAPLFLFLNQGNLRLWPNRLMVMYSP